MTDFLATGLPYAFSRYCQSTASKERLRIVAWKRNTIKDFRPFEIDITDIYYDMWRLSMYRLYLYNYFWSTS